MNLPRYNLINGKIENCKKGSFAYYHEYRHKIQIEEWGLLSKAFMILFWISTIVGGYYWGTKGFDFYTFILLLPAIIILAIDIDAHIYGLIQLRTIKRIKRMEVRK